MKKIGILTFHSAYNYGAVLQCYALQQTLLEFGGQVEIINYVPSYLMKEYRLFDISRIEKGSCIKIAKGIVREILHFPIRLKRTLNFIKFQKGRLVLSKKVTDKAQLQCYDMFVFGSDQIWNPKLTNGLDDMYLGKFGFPKQGRMYVSYAPSMEQTNLNASQQERFKQALGVFDAISVREANMKTMLQPLVQKDIECVIDPTLLASPNVWERIVGKVEPTEKYVLVYQIRTCDDTIRIANVIARQLGAKVLIITTQIHRKSAPNESQTDSPEKFLAKIKGAACVVTTSFHGTAFSLIFNRPFYCVSLGDGYDNRSKSLLESLGLQSRLLDKSTNPVFSEIEYLKVNERLNESRSQSLNFLKRNLS